MSARDALIVILAAGDSAPTWLRVIDGDIVQRGTGTDWLPACGLREWSADDTVMLVVPVEATTLHWISLPDLPVRQGRAAARLAALDASIGQSDTMLAVTDQQDDPAAAHLVAVVSRADIQHWLLWAQHHGIDPDIIIPSALVLPAPAEGIVRAVLGTEAVLRGGDLALAAADAIAPILIDSDNVVDLPDAAVAQALVAALDAPAINLRQGDFAKRTRTTLDTRQLARIAMWCGFIALVSLVIALIMILKLNADARRLDAQSVEVAQKVLPSANDAVMAEQELDSKLRVAGTGAYGFSGSTAGILAAMRSAPSVALTLLDRAPDGTLKATLAAPKADDINVVLIALQASGFTITATSSADPSGRVLADITVRP
ncbi:MAG: type II secretion system protein GspL [Sphingobium sp.]|uniref:type II secretion system protein GspL n=1 Tax=Sphingobium sp. TaxID=1912891 RepID=UPI0029BD54FB|nr:type II secretion system protein GspL [Sphingobium sp.]MDX3908864.1 type II secretion system protein GspL [Sphingobium sp.]